MINRLRRHGARILAGLAALAVGMTATAVSAETLLMPKRDFKMSTQEVVWGVTTQVNGTAFVLDYGDGSAMQSGNVADRSYIAFTHTYAIAGTFTVKLCVGPGAALPACAGGELATVEVRVYDPITLTPFDLRALNINRAIQDGLRYLWFSQDSRAANFPASMTTSWSGSISYTALVVLAFENHQYLLANDGSAPTGVYEKYLVQRGLYYVGRSVSQLQLTVQNAGTENPCVGAGIEPAPCTGLYDTFDPGYSTAVAALPFAGSTALNRTFPAGLGGASGVYITGKTFREVLQRMMNAIAYGQNDSGTGKGGWIYQFSNNSGQQSDGSTVGWDLLALLDAGAAGITIPAFVKTNFAAAALPNGLNSDGSFDYRADGNANPAFGNVNFQKGGIGLQGLYYAGTIGAGNAAVDLSADYLSDRWGGAALGGDYQFWSCGSPASNNKGCAYGMFNAFKGLKLHNIQTLPGVGRAAGPGAIPANDWHADYEDFLVATQTSPGTTSGGHWANLGFSCCGSSVPGSAAMAELILAPVALIQPDPTKFSTVGLTPFTATNVIGTSHTVTAKAESEGGAPVPGATISFLVLDGPNAGNSGSGITNAQGQVTFSYVGNVVGTDHIQASLGALKSNIVEKIWVVEVNECDVDNDDDVDQTDLNLIYAANRKPASGPNDPRDANHDGRITVSDYRYCQLRLTPVP
jgi:hypothetical protein